MKVSLNWLSDYIKLPADLSPQKLAHDLTMTTVEVESVEHQSEHFANMIVGQVKKISPHPNADRLRIATTEIGKGQIKEIVCGGSNLREGMLVAVAEPGAMVRWHGKGDLIQLGLAKIRGVESYGMICNSDEIGLGDLFPAASDHEIIDLSGLNLEVGAPLAKALGLDDIIIEIDNKSLTNRPDLWGHYGIARELAAIYSLPLAALPEFEMPNTSGPVQAKIQDPELCARYTGTLIENVKSHVSPLWMRVRLSSVGQRPISLLVDLTNYVLLAVGQPSHVFDTKRLAGLSMEVRSALQGEKLQLLDGTQLELPAGVLVIADSKKPLALAGVMGGMESGVDAETETVLLECANFNPVETRRLSSRFGVRTESSIRFEKGIDPERALQGAKLFLSMLSELQPQCKAIAWRDEFPKPLKKQVIKVNRKFIVSRVGLELSIEQISELLTRFGFQVEVKDEEFEIVVPSWRATGDVSIPEDIVEEVARLYGYDNLEFIAPQVKLDRAVKQPRQELDRAVVEYLAHCAGMQEIFSYPWVEESLLEAAGYDPKACFSLFAPPSPTASKLQPSLVPNLLAAASLNLHTQRQFSLFEVRRIFQSTKLECWSKGQESLPLQFKSMAAILVGADSASLIRQAKGVLEDLFEALAVAELSFHPDSTKAPWMASQSGLALKCGDKDIGHVGLLSLKTSKLAGLEHCKAAVIELNLSALEPLAVWERRFKELPKFPLVEYDLALLLADTVSWQEISAKAVMAHELIRQVSFLDEYRGAKIPEGQRSLAFKLTLGDEKATLTNERIQSAVDSVLKKLAADFGATLRAA